MDSRDQIIEGGQYDLKKDFSKVLKELYRNAVEEVDSKIP